MNYFLNFRRIHYNTTASIDDYTFFDNQTVNTDKSKAWPLHKNYNKVSSTDKLFELHKAQGTVAFLIIKKGVVVY